MTLAFHGPPSATRAGDKHGYRIELLSALGHRVENVAFATAHHHDATRTVERKLSR